MGRRRDKGRPGPHLRLAVGRWYLHPCAFLTVGGLFLLLLPSPILSFLFPCILPTILLLFHVFILSSIHPCIYPSTYLFMHASIHPSIYMATLLPPSSFPPSSLLLSIYSSSHLPMCLSCLSISSSPSTLLFVHHHPINKHLQSTRGCDLRLHEHDLRASVEDGFLRSGTIGGDQGVTLRKTKRPSCGEGAMGRLGSVPVSRCPVPCPSKESL